MNFKKLLHIIYYKYNMNCYKIITCYKYYPAPHLCSIMIDNTYKILMVGPGELVIISCNIFKIGNTIYSYKVE